MLAPANGPFLIITLFFGKQNVEWKGTGSIVIARVLACTTEREVLLLGHQTTENTRLRVSQTRPGFIPACYVLVRREETERAGHLAALSPRFPLSSPASNSRPTLHLLFCSSGTFFVLRGSREKYSLLEQSLWLIPSQQLIVILPIVLDSFIILCDIFSLYLEDGDTFLPDVIMISPVSVSGSVDCLGKFRINS